MAGIWMARVLADHFGHVTVVERDELPAQAEHRPGVPQDRQYHIMLRRGLQIMEDLFPAVGKVLQTAEPISPIYGYRRTENRWRHYEALSPWPDGFAVVGDAFCGFNPVYGQGMTVAAMTAVALGEQLARAGGNGRGLAARFQAQVAEVTKPVWLLTTGADLAYPETEGATDKKSAADRLAYWYMEKVMEAVPADERVRRVFLDVNHLLRPATDLFMPGVLWRVIRHSLARGSFGTAAAGVVKRQPRTR